MSVRLSSFALALGLALSLTATAQTPTPAATATPKPTATPKAGKATPTPVATVMATPTPTPTPMPTPEVMATPEPEPTPEPMPTPEPIPEEGVNAGKPTGALVHGFVITRYDNSDGKGVRKASNAYSIQNARIRLEGKSAPGVTYLAALEPLLATGPLQEAYIGWNPEKTFGPLKMLRLRAGQMRKPIGLEGRTPEEALHTMDHTITTRLLQGLSNYDLGMTVGTTISIIELDVGIFNGTGPYNTLFPTTTAGGQDPLDDKLVLGRAGVTLLENRVRTGFSITSGETTDPLAFVPAGSPGLPPTVSAKVWRASVDVMAEIANIVVQSEVVYGNSTIVTLLPGVGNGPTATSGSAYLFAGYRLPGGFLPHLRFEYIEASMGDDYTDPDGPLVAPRDWNNAVAVGVNWDPVKHVRIRSQYEFVTGLASQPQNNTYYNPASGAIYSDEMSGTFSVSAQADF